MNSKTTPQSEAERLIKRFTTFLNYDQVSDISFHDPFDRNQVRHSSIRKDAIRLAIICVEEVIDNIDYQVNTFQGEIKKELQKQLKS